MAKKRKVSSTETWKGYSLMPKANITAFDKATGADKIFLGKGAPGFTASTGEQFKINFGGLTGGSNVKVQTKSGTWVDAYAKTMPDPTKQIKTPTQGGFFNTLGTKKVTEGQFSEHMAEIGYTGIRDPDNILEGDRLITGPWTGSTKFSDAAKERGDWKISDDGYLKVIDYTKSRIKDDDGVMVPQYRDANLTEQMQYDSGFTIEEKQRPVLEGGISGKLGVEGELYVSPDWYKAEIKKQRGVESVRQQSSLQRYNQDIQSLQGDKTLLEGRYNYNRVLLQKLKDAKEGKGLRTWVSKTGTRDAGTVTTKVGFDMPGGEFYTIATPKSTRRSRGGLRVQPGATTVDDFDFDAKIAEVEDDLVYLPLEIAEYSAFINTKSKFEGGKTIADTDVSYNQSLFGSKFNLAGMHQDVFESDDYDKILAPTAATQKAGKQEEDGLQGLYIMLVPGAFTEDGERRTRKTLDGRSVPVISDEQLNREVQQHYAQKPPPIDPEQQTEADKTYLKMKAERDVKALEEFKDTQTKARRSVLSQYGLDIHEEFGIPHSETHRYLQGSATLGEIQADEMYRLFEAQEKAAAAEEARRIEAEQLAEKKRLEEEERLRIEEEKRLQAIAEEEERQRIAEERRATQQYEFETTTGPKRPYKYKKSAYNYHRLKYGSNR